MAREMGKCERKPKTMTAPFAVALALTLTLAHLTHKPKRKMSPLGIQDDGESGGPATLWSRNRTNPGQQQNNFILHYPAERETERVSVPCPLRYLPLPARKILMAIWADFQCYNWELAKGKGAGMRCSLPTLYQAIMWASQPVSRTDWAIDKSSVAWPASESKP